MNDGEIMLLTELDIYDFARRLFEQRGVSVSLASVIAGNVYRRFLEVGLDSAMTSLYNSENKMQPETTEEEEQDADTRA